MPIEQGPKNLEVSSFTPRTAETYADRAKGVNMELGINESPINAGELPTIIMPEKQVFQDNLKELGKVVQIKENANTQRRPEHRGFLEHTEPVHRIEFAIPEQNKQRIITRIEDYLFYESSANLGVKHNSKNRKQKEIQLPSEIRQEITPQDIIDFIHVLLTRGAETAWPISLSPCDRLRVNILTLIPTIESLAKLFDILQLYKLQNFQHVYFMPEYNGETGELGIFNKQTHQPLKFLRNQNLHSKSNSTVNSGTGAQNNKQNNGHLKITRPFLSVFTHLIQHKHMISILAGIATLYLDQYSYNNSNHERHLQKENLHTSNMVYILLNSLNKAMCLKLSRQHNGNKNSNFITHTLHPLQVRPLTDQGELAINSSHKRIFTQLYINSIKLQLLIH